MTPYFVDERGAIISKKILQWKLGTALQIGISGGAGLRVGPNDPSIADISESTSPASPDRQFKITPKRAANVMVEAWYTNQSAPVVDYFQLAIVTSRRGSGPTLGKDGEIPKKYHGTVSEAIEMAWKLDEDPKFVETFRDTIAKLTNQPLTSDLFATALNKMVINYAETSRDPRIVKELKDDAKEKKRDPQYQSAPAFSFGGGSNIWIRDFSLKTTKRAVAANIIHEASHLVGAPGNLLAEIALDAIHSAAGLPR